MFAFSTWYLGDQELISMSGAHFLHLYDEKIEIYDL